MSAVPIRFTIDTRCADSAARAGRIETPHGAFDTPAFMPVGTRGSIRGLPPNLVAGTGSQIILANTFHLALRPGAERVKRLGGLHAFMQWPGPILTDSGGYQVFSLADAATITDEGAVFRSPVDGAEIALTPERAIEIQRDLGADIIMALDDCPPSVDPRRAASRGAAAAPAHRSKREGPMRIREASERTIRWLERCAEAHGASPARERQALFGIIQGGTDLDDRQWSIDRVCSVELPGYAIGGVAVGEGPDEIRTVVQFAGPRLPETKPRYLMGVGYEADLVMAVRAGCDMFDCVLPTRNGRAASAFTRAGQIRLKNACFADDPRPLDPACDCLCCAPQAHGWSAPIPGLGSPEGAADGPCFSRAYLRHLFLAGEMLGPMLVSLHNVRHFQRLMVDIRRAIREDAWSALARAWPVAASALDGDASARR